MAIAMSGERSRIRRMVKLGQDKKLCGDYDFVMVDFDHPDRRRDVINTVGKEVLKKVFSQWARIGYTTNSVGFAREGEFDKSDPMSPRGYGWEEVEGSGWWFLLWPGRIPIGRGSKKQREMISRRDEAIKMDRERGYQGVNGDLFW